MSDEDDVKKVTEEIMNAFVKGDAKAIIKSMDFKETKVIWTEFLGPTDKRAQMSDKDFEKDYKKEIEQIYNRPWNVNWTIESMSISDNRAEIKVMHENAKSLFKPLVLSKKTKKWKMIQIPLWTQ